MAAPDEPPESDFEPLDSDLDSLLDSLFESLLDDDELESDELDDELESDFSLVAPFDELGFHPFALDEVEALDF